MGRYNTSVEPFNGVPNRTPNGNVAFIVEVIPPISSNSAVIRDALGTMALTVEEYFSDVDDKVMQKGTHFKVTSHSSPEDALEEAKEFANNLVYLINNN